MTRLLGFLLLSLCVMTGKTAFAQPAETGDTNAAIDELKADAKAPDVIEELEEPDGVSIDPSDPENWKIIAMGTGTYEFNDTEERSDAQEEAELNAKAHLAKFMKEKLKSDQQLDILAERESTKSKANGEETGSARTKRMKTSLKSIHNSAEEILSGVITLETTSKWNGNSGEVRVKIGQSEKTLAAANRFKKRTNASVRDADEAAAGASGDGKKVVGGAKAGSDPEVIKRKTKSAF
jgi:hypothetical protein